MVARTLVALAVAALLSACGKNTTSPVVPSAPDFGEAQGGGGGAGGDEDAGTGGGGGEGGGAGGGAGGGSGAGAGGGSGGGAGGGSDGGSGGADAGVIRFIAIGDTGKGDADQQKVATAMANKCAAEGCDFVWMLGDNIYPSGVSGTADTQFQSKFELVYAGVNVPFWVVLGNHDYGGDGAGNEFSKGQHEVDYSNVSTKWKMPAKYYTVKFGDVEFFAMDTNMQMYHSDSDQRTKVAQWIAQSTAKWKISVGHHPYKSNGKHGNAGDYDGVSWLYIANGEGVKDFFNDIVCGKVDVSLSGHDHSRQWLQGTCNGTQLIVSGAGASVTTLPGNQANWWQGATLGFVYVVVTGSSMTIEFVSSDGVSDFKKTITK